MTIHHATRAKAEKAGIVLSDDPKTFLEYSQETPPKDAVRAHYPKFNLVAYGIGAQAAFEQVAALIRIKSHDDTRAIVTNAHDPFEVAVYNADRSLTPYRGYAVPVDAYNAIVALDGKKWLTTKVPDNGAEAHKQGFTAADNPYSDDDGEAIDGYEEDHARWDEEFDTAIEADEEPEDAGGSVVKEVYRIRYAEAGHPNHCGDWLAETLNNFVLGKAATDLAVFERICEENGVNLSKYRRDGNGWQGRLRMTGRNLLARVVYSNDGVLKLPAGLVENTTEVKATSEWMADQNFKVKKPRVVAPAPAPEPKVEEDDSLIVEIPPVEEPKVSRAEQMRRIRASKANK